MALSCYTCCHLGDMDAECMLWPTLGHAFFVWCYACQCLAHAFGEPGRAPTEATRVVSMMQNWLPRSSWSHISTLVKALCPPSLDVHRGAEGCTLANYQVDRLQAATCILQATRQQCRLQMAGEIGDAHPRGGTDLRRAMSSSVPPVGARQAPGHCGSTALQHLRRQALLAESGGALFCCPRAHSWCELRLRRPTAAGFATSAGPQRRASLPALLAFWDPLPEHHSLKSWTLRSAVALAK